MQGNNALIHQVYTATREIEKSLETSLPQSPITSDEERIIKSAFQKRKSAMLHPIHFAASLLDPTSQGFHLSEEEQLEGIECIHKIATDMKFDASKIISELANYRAKHDAWSKSFLWSCAQSTDPIAFWKGLCATKDISKVAIRILSAPVTSAATERSFSKFGFIHSKNRNKLETDRAGKITYIAFNSKFLKAQPKNDSKNEVEQEVEEIENNIEILESKVTENNINVNIAAEMNFNTDEDESEPELYMMTDESDDESMVDVMVESESDSN